MYRHAYVMKTHTNKFEKGQIVFKTLHPNLHHFIGRSEVIEVVGKHKYNNNLIKGWVTCEGNKEYINVKYIGKIKVIGFNRKIIFLNAMNNKYGIGEITSNFDEKLLSKNYGYTNLIPFYKGKRELKRNLKKYDNKINELEKVKNLQKKKWFEKKWEETNKDYVGKTVSELKKMPIFKR
jgi:hypothetical protein